LHPILLFCKLNIEKIMRGNLKEGTRKRKKIGFFGHFGQINFGNESTLQAILYHLRRHLPDAELTCICTEPEIAATTHNIHAVPMKGIFVKPAWLRGHPLTRLLRKIIIGLPSELYRWVEAFRVLRGVDMLIVPGTGLLTDAYHRVSWGPYSVFKWSLTAKLCGCQLLFVSVGAGPLYSPLGRSLIKSALSLADFRSYRDNATMNFLKKIGFPTDNDRVYPDLAFSLPEAVIPRDGIQKRRRPVVGLGVMQYAGRLSIEKPSNAIYWAYLENLVIFVKWLLAHEYDVRLLIGDIFDKPVVQEFRNLLRERLSSYDAERIIDEPVFCVEDLLSQLAATDVVVATRFHNVLLALLLNKPVISISFHQKCVSLMSEVGLSEYCQDINHLSHEWLIEKFSDLEKNAAKLKPLIKQKTEEFGRALDEQYQLIFKEFFGSAGSPPPTI
jgi:polysaccharide pyruvyl transferase WcaK-like protein